MFSGHVNVNLGAIICSVVACVLYFTKRKLLTGITGTCTCNSLSEPCCCINLQNKPFSLVRHVIHDSIWFPASPNLMHLLTKMTEFSSQQVPTSRNYFDSLCNNFVSRNYCFEIWTDGRKLTMIM